MAASASSARGASLAFALVLVLAHGGAAAAAVSMRALLAEPWSASPPPAGISSAGSDAAGFVRVADDGSGFELDGTRFYVSGANAYWHARASPRARASLRARCSEFGARSTAATAAAAGCRPRPSTPARQSTSA